MELEKLIIKIAKILDKYKIPYMIIGGQAVLIYGEARLTKDIDITIGLDIDLYDILLKAINEINLMPSINNIKDFIKDTYVLPTYDRESDFRVDFIFSFSDYEKEALKRVKKIKIGKKYVNFSSLEDLIIHKIISGRPRDLEDIKNVLIKNRDFNKNYVKQWLKEFEKILDENLLDRFEDLLKKVN
ncbi:hypothetical protein GX420_02225 [bacterium]|nr:hypothetical protein [bacterium]